MKILFSEVLEGVYARSALATLDELSAAPLLHPGHARALTRTLRDLAVLMARHLPRGIAVASIDDTGIEIEISGAALPAPHIIAATLKSALVEAALHTVSSAAGIPADVFNILADNLSTFPSPAIIAPCRY